MKKVVFKKQLLPVIMSFCACFAAVEGAPEAPAAQDKGTVLKDGDCSKDLLLAYFPEIFVKETLAKFNVPKDKWDALIKGLNEKDKDVIKMVEEKASQMNPNPLKDPQHRQAAVKLFRETLLDVFSNVLKTNGITDNAQIASMLDDIQQQKAKRFALCIKRDIEAELDDDSDDDDEDDFDDEDDEDDEEEDEKNLDDKAKDAASDVKK